VLIAAALLTSLPPAQSAEAPRGLVLHQTVEDVRFTLQIDPGRIGGNRFNVALRDANNNAIDDARRVRLRFTPPSSDLGENVADAEPQGDGVYAMRGNFLSLVGRWRIEIGIQRPDRFDTFARFELDLSSGSVSASDVLWPLLAALALIGVGTTYLFAMRRLVATPRMVRRALSIIPAIAIAGLGLSFALGALQNTSGELLNPIPPDARSIAAGRELYEQNCFVCHGPTGRGDGPAAINLNPRPVDLVQHVIVGVHPDAQLFDWISNGYPNSAMPAFASTLSENERWDVLNFIRTFANQ
jgi:mono/diheme cytochrome c family protein